MAKVKEGKTDKVEPSGVTVEQTASQHRFGEPKLFEFERWDLRDRNFSYHYWDKKRANVKRVVGWAVCQKEEIERIKPVFGEFNENGHWEVEGSILMRLPEKHAKDIRKHNSEMWKDNIKSDKARLKERGDELGMEVVDERSTE